MIPLVREELEDAYARYAGKRVLRDRWQETAFSNTSQAEPFYTLNVTMGFLPVDRLKEIAARYGASITEYLSAVLLQSILENQEVQRPPPSQARGSGHSHRSPGLVPLRHPPQLHPHCPALRGPHSGALHLPLSWSDTSTTTCACTSIPRRCGPASPAMSTSQPTAFSS